MTTNKTHLNILIHGKHCQREVLNEFHNLAEMNEAHVARIGHLIKAIFGARPVILTVQMIVDVHIVKIC